MELFYLLLGFYYILFSFSREEDIENVIKKTLILMRVLNFSGGNAGNRTQDHRLKRALLYRLSYVPATSSVA